MGQYRTYFTKDNTITMGNDINTGLNPIISLRYGSPNKVFSRSIFSFDVDNLKSKIENKIINGDIKHTLNLINTVAYDRTPLNNLKEFQEDHASSFDLVLFKVPEFWDEGVGYDYVFTKTILDVNGKIVSGASNYYKRTTIDSWKEQGIYSGSTSAQYQEITTIHFDLGNENIKVDITDLVNDLILSGDTSFFGLGLAFKNDIENLTTDFLYGVDFYGKDTHTFFEPFVETTWNNTIDDDRNSFFYDKDNKLYLYSNVYKTPINLDFPPSSVEIYDYDDNLINTITGVTHEGLGVYSVPLSINSEDYGNQGLINFTDIWTGISMRGKSLPDVSMEFTVRQNNYFNLGSEIFEPQDFAFNFTGIKRGESIVKGEVRKIIISVREYFQNDLLMLDNLYYTIYVKQGNNRIVVVPETRIDQAFQQNYIYLDTSWMIVQDYFMDILVHSNGTITKKSDVNFSIIDGKSIK